MDAFVEMRHLIPTDSLASNIEYKYIKQYYNLIIINSNSFHDRFIIIDKSILYHCGSSFKDLGKKCFAINKIEDNNCLINIVKRINSK